MPTQAPILITPEEPRVVIIVGSRSIDFFLDIGATYSVLTEAPGPLSSRSASVVDCLGSPLPTLLCLFGQSLSRDLQNFTSSEAVVL